MKTYYKNCPLCKNIIEYKTKSSCDRSIKNNSKCFNCLRIRKNNPFYGKHHSRKTKNKLSTIAKNRSPEIIKKMMRNFNFKGKRHTQKSKEKIKNANTGIIFSLNRRSNISKSLRKNGNLKGNKNPSKREDVKAKIRIKIIERIKNLNGKCCPLYNPKACKYFNILDENILHAENGGEFYLKKLGYFADGYNPKTNTWYEWDENHHYQNNEIIKKDKRRMDEIIDELKCKFVRIKQKDMTIKEY